MPLPLLRAALVQVFCACQTFDTERSTAHLVPIATAKALLLCKARLPTVPSPISAVSNDGVFPLPLGEPCKV